MKSLLPLLLIPGMALAQKKSAPPIFEKNKTLAAAEIQGKYDHYKNVALTIWDYAEVGYKEEKSTALLQKELKDNGFDVQAGLVGIPTSFVATYGSGSPVIGILAEYDALPGIMQDASPERHPAAGKTAGHACGHHLFGTASVAAGIAIKNQMMASGWRARSRYSAVPPRKAAPARSI